MGQKIHPYGYRVGITQPHSARWFANNYQYPQYVFEDFLLRQSLFKNLPVENLPRKRTEDKSETKLVQIKIERLIRNTIKIKLYVTSPETASELFEHEAGSVNEISPEGKANLAKSPKKDFGATNPNKINVNLESKNEINTSFLNRKRLLDKKLLQLQILKLQNMQSKLLTMKNLLDGSLNTKVFVQKNDIFSLESTINNYPLHLNNIAINSSIAKSLLEGIKDCLNMNLDGFNKVKYLFYFLQLKKQVSKALLYQLDLYQKVEKQKLVNFLVLNKSEEQISAFQNTINLRLLKLKALSLKWTNHSRHLTNVLVNIQSKLTLELETLVVKLDQNKTNLNQKCAMFINILKFKYMLRKNNFNKLELSVLNQKIEEIKLKWFQSVTITGERKEQILVELNMVACEKQKMLTLLNKFKFSLNFYNTHLEKTKRIILSGLFLLSKFNWKKEVLNELNTFLSKSFLIVKKLETHLGKNYKILQERVVLKINHMTILENTIKQNLNVLQILKIAQEHNTTREKINPPSIFFPSFFSLKGEKKEKKRSKLYKNLFNVFYLNFLSNFKKTKFNHKNKTFLYDFLSESFDKYASLISHKVINLNSSLICYSEEKTNQIPKLKLNDKFLMYGLLKKEYLSHLICLFKNEDFAFFCQFFFSLKEKKKREKKTAKLQRNKIAQEVSYSSNYYKSKVLYQFSLTLLNQRYKLNKIIEIKIKNLLLQVKSEKPGVSKNACLVSIRDLNISLKSNTLFIKQLETWLTLLKKKLTENTSTNRYLLQARIHKINCYLKKIIPIKITLENNLVSTIEKNFIFVNYNILKQKLLAEFLQMQQTIIVSKKKEWEKEKAKLFLSNSFFTKDNISSANLNQTLQILQNRLLDLQNRLSQEKGQKFAVKSENSSSFPLLRFENKKNQERELTLATLSHSKTLQLKTTLQQLLKTNYENSFIVLQTRRQVYNSVINRLGGYRKFGKSGDPILEKEKIWKNPFETAEYLDFKLNLTQVENSTDAHLTTLLETIKQKIYERKPIKLIYTRKQKFLAKKTIKKKLKHFLVLMALKNNYTNLSSLKNIYDVKTFAKLCENLTNVQTMPKVSVIELVKVHQPKQYAVCLANFVVENLEKRFSFRSTMKRASEQAMSTTNVKGIKIQISGRLNGAEIARTEWLRDGVVPLQTLRANIDYSYKTAKTIYGILGVKVWLFKDTPANMNS
jgi:ribosomal protein S3